MAAFFRKINGNKVHAAAACICDQTEAHAQTVYQSAENTDKQRIVSDRLHRYHICEHTGQDNYNTGAYGKFFADKLKSDHNGNGIQNNIDDRVGNGNPYICLKNILQKQGDPVKTAGVKSACPHKSLNVYGKDDTGDTGAAVAHHFVFEKSFFIQFHNITSRKPTELPICRTRRTEGQDRLRKQEDRFPGSLRVR